MSIVTSPLVNPSVEAAPVRTWRWPNWATLLLVALTVCYRRPDQVLRPSFSYEAGTVMFAEDRAYGVSAFAVVPGGTAGGYLITIPRIVAFLGGLVSLPWVPTVYNLLSCLVLVGVAAMCLYARIDTPYRHLLALSLALVPNGGEVFLDINLLQVVCAPLFVLLILQRDAERPWQWIVDIVVLLLIGLTGPYVVLFVGPLLLVRFARGGFTRYNVTLAAVALLVTAVQLTLLVHSGRLVADYHQTSAPVAAAHVPAGETADPIVWMDVISLAFVGSFLFGNILPLGSQLLTWTVTLAFLLTMYAMIRTIEPSIRPNLLIVLGAAVMMTAVQLYRSRTFPTYDHPFGNGQRYFYLPYVFVCWGLIMACADKGWIRTTAWFFLGMMLLSSATQFCRQVVPDTHWKQFARMVDKGYEVVIPINPEGWSIQVGPHDRGRKLPEGHNNGYYPDRPLGIVRHAEPGSMPPSSDEEQQPPVSGEEGPTNEPAAPPE